MEIDAAADDAPGPFGMHGDGVAIRHLPFVGQIPTRHISPGVAAITRAKHAKQTVGKLTRAVRGERVQHLGIGRTNDQASAMQSRRWRESVGQVRPALPAIGRTVNPFAALRRNRSRRESLVS